MTGCIGEMEKKMMDPYKVLGVSRDASDEEIKKQYRKLSRIYHPDANLNNPNAKEAEEKFKQVQQAYQQIMKEKENGGYGAGAGYQGTGNYGGYGGFGGFGNRTTSNYQEQEEPYLQAAANYIQAGRYAEALNVLGSIENRSARWYYYSGIANAGAGNNVLALQHAKTALSMEPGNWQYQQLVSQLESGGDWYQGMRSPYGSTVYMGDDCCSKLCLANILLNLCCNGCLC